MRGAHRMIGLLLSSGTLLLAGCGDDDSGTDAGDNGNTNAGGNVDTQRQAVEGASWADHVSITFGDDSFTFESDGLPDHGALDAYALMGGGTIGVDATNTSIEVPLTPTLADSPTDTGLGSIGVAVSGAVFFNPYEGDGTTVALDDNFDNNGVPFIDACNGHPLGSGGSYHYHGIPYCITDVLDTPGQHSALLGYLLDGFPVYGPQDEGGAAPTDLDGCSSHFGPTPEYPDGIRHYHLTETAPYSIPCYVGEVTAGPGGGGPPGGGPPPGR